MNFGCPVVSSTAEGLKETCGPAAYYIDPLSVESMHKGIEEVLENQILGLQPRYHRNCDQRC